MNLYRIAFNDKILSDIQKCLDIIHAGTKQGIIAVTDCKM